MGLLELDLNLTDEQKAMRDLVRKFGAEVMRPAAIALDKLPDPEDVIAKDSVLWDVIRQYRKLGFHRAGFPSALGGLKVDPLTNCLILEELGYYAADLTTSLLVASHPFLYTLMSPYPEIQSLTAQYCADEEGKIIGCWAITEPDHGSDWLLFDGPDSQSPRCAGSLRSTKDGDSYIINGQKAAWVSNGTIATHASLFVTLDAERGQSGGGVAVVPLDRPGVSRGKPLNKLGQRAMNQGEIFFDNVRIPSNMMIVFEPDAYKALIESTLVGANAGMGLFLEGLARAALDEALQYARQRIQGGKPIIEHQNVQLKLFDMFATVEAARSLARRVSVFNAVSRPPALQYSIASKVFCTEAAFKVASEAIQIFGGNGLSKDYHIEKIFRDARASMIEDGVNETLALGGAARLVEREINAAAVAAS